MAYQRNIPYYMISHAGAGKCLNVSGSEQVSNNRNVCLLGKSTSKAQSWSIVTFDAGDKIVNGLNQAFALDYSSASLGNAGNCDILVHFGNDAHTCVTLIAVNAPSDIYKIKLKNYNLYLTAKGMDDNADVRWEPPVSSGSTQQWRFRSFQSAGGTKLLPMPSGPRCNWNQKHSGITSLFGASACTLVAGLDAANFYATDGVGFGPASMRAYWGDDGYKWGMPGPGAFNGRFRSADYTQDQLLAKIKEEIDAGRPPVIDIGYVVDKTHTVFCYGYKNGAATY